MDPERWSACITGALTREAYSTGLNESGFEAIEIVDTHQVAEGYASAIIRGRKPESSSTPKVSEEMLRPVPVIQGSCC